MVGAPLVAAALLLAALTAAHPLHTTYTEVAEDTGAPTVTVTVRSFTDDLSRAVAGTTSTAGTQAPIPGDSALARYIRSRFSVADPSGRILTLEYVGRRQSADLSWVIFSTRVSAGLPGCRITNRLQTELYADQVNLVQARYAGRSETLLFEPGGGARILP